MAEIFNTKLLNVSSCYLRLLNVSVTETTLKQQLLENPFFPSLYSLSNTFDSFQVSSKAFKIDKQNFDQLHPPFIAYLKKQTTGKDFVLVTTISKNEVEYIAESKKPKQISKETFLKNWRNIMLQAEPDEHSSEKDYSLNFKKEIAANNKTTALIAAW